MNQHTPGPWTIEPVNDGSWKVQILGDRTGCSSVVVADMPIRFSTLPANGHHATWDKQMANARLIAAAPELLEALRECLTSWPHSALPWDKMKAAIRKAEGG